MRIKTILTVVSTATLLGCIENIQDFHEVNNKGITNVSTWTKNNSKTGKADSLMTISYMSHKDIIGETMSDTTLQKKYNPMTEKYELTRISTLYGAYLPTAPIETHLRKDTAEEQTQDLFLNAEKSWMKYVNKINEQEKVNK